MAGIFVSHAAADSTLVDPLVDTLIRLGCGLSSNQIFYSSGEDTGVPSGENLNTFVRDRVADAELVVAVITPAFQTRPFCVAELGVAWARIGKLMPIALPGMDRTDLDGVLAGITVRFLDEGSALDELHDRIGEATGHPTEASTWGRYKEQWLANVESYAEDLPEPETATIGDVTRLQTELDGARQALVDSEARRRTLETQVIELADAKSADDVAEILLPEDESERFAALCKAASGAARKVDRIVIEALWYAKFSDEGGMPWPSTFDDRDRDERAHAASRDRTLVENASDLLVPNYDMADIADAYEAIDALRQFLDDEISEAFENWFRDEFRMPPDLRSQRLFDQLI
jgi:TIR domain